MSGTPFWDDLTLEIARIEARLKTIDRIPAPPAVDWRAWADRDVAVRSEYARLIAELRERGARISDGSPLRMRHLGVATTSAEGMHGLLRNWINAARRRIERET